MVSLDTKKTQRWSTDIDEVLRSITGPPSISTTTMAGLPGFKITSELYFGGLTRAAKDLDRLEKAGETVPSTGKYDFSVNDACSTCHQNIQGTKKALRCSACKAVLYCSKEVISYYTQVSDVAYERCFFFWHYH